MAIPADSRCDVHVGAHTGTKGDPAALKSRGEMLVLRAQLLPDSS